VTVRRLASHFAARLLAAPVASYITKHRDRLAERATPLSHQTRDHLTAYFNDANLDRVRFLESDSPPITEPPFSFLARRIGFDLPSTSLIAGITFDYVIAGPAGMSKQVLFHELVHVIQFRMLGVDRFALLYARGFLLHGRYDSIPLERCALELEHRFDSGESPFSVEAEVAAWIARDLF
jgi:hypothetical protein